MFCTICNRIDQEIPDMGSTGRRGFHVDHINGNRNEHQIENLQILCWKCNQTKLDMLDLTDVAKSAIKVLTDEYYAQMWTAIYFGHEWKEI